MSDNQNTIEMLKKAGLRLTKQRIFIGDLLFGSKHKHVSVESLHNQIEKLGKKMALATVYNCLHHFQRYLKTNNKLNKYTNNWNWCFSKL